MNSVNRQSNRVFKRRGVPIYYSNPLAPLQLAKLVQRQGLNIPITSTRTLHPTALKLHRFAPNLMIIGAQKCGTTSLHDLLSRHSEIHMSPIKELNYFLDDSPLPRPASAEELPSPQAWHAPSRSLRRGFSDYTLRWIWMSGYQGERYLGDSCPYYSARGVLGEDIPGRLASANPQFKIIYLIRNPIDRVYSAYQHDKRKAERIGQQHPPLEEALTRCPNLLRMSLYFEQLAPYREHFDQSQILVYSLENMTQQFEQFLSTLSDFLQVDRSGFGDIDNRNSNTTQDEQAIAAKQRIQQHYGEVLSRDAEQLEKSYPGITANWKKTNEPT